MTALEFFTEHIATFKSIFAQHLNVEPQNVQLLSVQETPRERIPRAATIPSSATTDLDILFTVSRGGGRGMLKPDHVYTRLKHDFQNIADRSGKMKYQLTTEMCTPGVCQRGECRERVYLDDQQQTVISIGGIAFVAPHHNRIAECICPEGYGGQRCELEINACARSPCQAWEMCVPSHEGRHDCICPPGTTGDRCSQPSCENEGRCLEEAELSLVDGRVIYRWDAGSGEGSVATDASIADAQWHRISLSRRGRRTRLVLDGADTKEGWSPPGTLALLDSFF
ncbi:unnamed protein product [Strongylus vulgaris]|uniref:EGF-like domain-containing protein n=1 Tax=Strongylus vulgaris TaxID=40348 RepID=A0A3P7LY75_STRVU|nr:unnamed protein product [Strongylus vulgaris]